jgi:hypothetical protein
MARKGPTRRFCSFTKPDGLARGTDWRLVSTKEGQTPTQMAAIPIQLGSKPMVRPN